MLLASMPWALRGGQRSTVMFSLLSMGDPLGAFAPVRVAVGPVLGVRKNAGECADPILALTLRQFGAGQCPVNDGAALHVDHAGQHHSVADLAEAGIPVVLTGIAHASPTLDVSDHVCATATCDHESRDWGCARAPGCSAGLLPPVITYCYLYGSH